MKKFEVRSLLALLLAVVTVLAFTACGGKVDETLPPDDTTDVVEPDVTEPDVTDPPADTEPEETDPKYDPIVTEPVETDPPETEPVETEPPHVHDFKKTSTVSANCLAEGYTEYTCKTCGETKKDDVKPKTTHVYTTTIITYASCGTDGESADVCIYCGDKKASVVIPASGCWVQPVEAPIASFTHHTGIVYKCVYCGNIESITPTEEHEFKLKTAVADQVSASGDVSYGYEVLACDCGYEKTVASNSADGHCYTVDEGSGKYVCECGDVLTKEFKDVYNGNVDAGVAILPKN